MLIKYKNNSPFDKIYQEGIEDAKKEITELLKEEAKSNQNSMYTLGLVQAILLTKKLNKN